MHNYNTMTHAALIALMNNQPFVHVTTTNEIIQNMKTILKGLIELIKVLIKSFINKLLLDLSKNKHLIIISILLTIYVIISTIEYNNYLYRMKDTEDQIQYLKRKNKIQEGNIEFLLAKNELKISKLTKQVKKLQKEINEYA